ncbi:MAG TPA: helix-turn-helix domain-containing protein [Armatimonadota bacterium]|nr:helix-turn-helix domain-containing protein [Armatimonadota bacterium]
MVTTINSGAVSMDARTVRTTREMLGLNQPEFARLVGVSPRSVAGWERGERISDTGERLLRQARDLAEQLAGLAESPAALGEWLTAPNDYFDGLKPLEVVERGQVSRLLRFLYRLEAGEPG